MNSIDIINTVFFIFSFDISQKTGIKVLEIDGKEILICSYSFENFYIIIVHSVLEIISYFFNLKLKHLRDITLI